MDGPKKPLKSFITKDGDFNEILLSTQVVKKWGILPGEFLKVNKKKILESSEDVSINEKVENTICRLENKIAKEERAKDPFGRSQEEVRIDKECKEIKKRAIENYLEVLKKGLGKEDRVKCEPKHW